MISPARGDPISVGANEYVCQNMVPWRERIDLSISNSRKIKGGNYVQIATIENGKPKCRTVVFRGFLNYMGSEWMKMITDARSEKVTQIASSPACEMVWWFSQSSEQYRISGDLHLAGPTGDPVLLDARLQQWKNLSDPAREQFYWIQPGADYSPVPEGVVPVGGRGSEGKILPPPDNFLLLLLEPKQVKYLRLRDNYAQFDFLSDITKSNALDSSNEIESCRWTSRRVNP